MTDRPSEPPAGRRMNTGEFRAMPDASASTAEFQAFVAERSDATGQWDVNAPDRSPARIALLVGVVVAILAVVGILAAVLT